MPVRQQFLVYQSNGKHHWKFVANTGVIVAVSPEGYDNEHECLDAIEAVQDQASNAAIVDRLFDPTALAVVR
ncbi:MAG TPA: YegP family protein [Actinomycetota bacterium]|nr:YegP family protein [Actinomycetota bacterium]